MLFHMAPLEDWPAAEVLITEALVLEPLRVEHAVEMAPILDDASLHTFTGGTPATFEQLTKRYQNQAKGGPEDGGELWFNWVLRRTETHEAAGYVQATVSVEDGRAVAEVAWVVARRFQGRGFARQAAVALVDWLNCAGADQVIAHVHPDHAASNAVAAAAGLRPTAVMIDGEVRWSNEPS